eukprot:11311523-Ditylum_brightwellii.AAC.1
MAQSKRVTKAAMLEYCAIAKKKCAKKENEKENITDTNVAMDTGESEEEDKVETYKTDQEK